MTLTVHVNGSPLHALGYVSDLTVTTVLRGGSNEATWSMMLPDYYPARLRAGDSVQVTAAGTPIWSGTLSSPDREDGWSFAAVGLWRNGEKAYALDASGNGITKIDEAIDQALARDSRLGWRRVESIKSGDLDETTYTAELNRLADLLNTHCDDTDRHWRVTPQGHVETFAEGGGRRWHLTPGVATWGETTEDSVSALMLRYRDSVDGNNKTYIATHSTAPYGEQAINAVDRGPISATAVASIGSALVTDASRPSWTNAISIEPGEITTPGGVRAPLWMVQAGDELLIPEASPGSGSPHTVITIGETAYNADENTLGVTPKLMASRDLASRLAEVIGS